MKCPNCGKEAVLESRAEHAADVLAGKAVDPMQKEMVSKGLKPSPIDVVEDHPHPNLKNADGSPIMMKGNGTDLREVCKSCGNFGEWRAQG